MEIIKLEKVNYAYENQNLALKDVDMSIEKGEKVAVLGPNGAGKSTLFQMFNGLLKPSSGKVTVDGMELTKKNLSKIRSTVGMVFQDSDDQLFNSTVRQEIAYGLMNMGVSGDELEDSIKWALDVVKMGEYIDRSPHSLSGGQKKRIALASVLVMKPKVLVLDEPTSALDPHGVSNLIRLLNSINKELQMTLIFSTHDTDIVPLIADKIYLLDKGQVILKGSTAEVFEHKEILRKVGLRLPRVAHLTEILEHDSCLNAEDLPLTISEARRLFRKNMNSDD